MTAARRVCGKTALAAVAALALAAPARAEWRWSFTPYFWASEIGADVSVNDKEILEREMDLADLVDDLDFAIQLHAEGQKGAHGLMFDLTYIDLGDDDKTFPAPGALPGEVVVKGDLETTILEAGGIWNPRADGTGFSLLYGTRILDFDEEIDARYDFPAPLADPSRRYTASATLVDALLGVRYLGKLSDRWSFLFRADASTGDTESTWNSQLGFGYTFGKGGNKTLFAGYRYMEIELDEADRGAEIEIQNKLGGFITGLRFTR